MIEQELRTKLSDLQSALEANNPGFKDLLRQIHVGLKQDEALVHLLSEEEIAIIISGLKKNKILILVQDAKKSPRKSAKDVTEDDI